MASNYLEQLLPAQALIHGVLLVEHLLRAYRSLPKKTSRKESQAPEHLEKNVFPSDCHLLKLLLFLLFRGLVVV